MVLTVMELAGVSQNLGAANSRIVRDFSPGFAFRRERKQVRLKCDRGEF